MNMKEKTIHTFYFQFVWREINKFMFNAGTIRVLGFLKQTFKDMQNKISTEDDSPWTWYGRNAYMGPWSFGSDGSKNCEIRIPVDNYIYTSQEKDKIIWGSFSFVNDVLRELRKNKIDNLVLDMVIITWDQFGHCEKSEAISVY